MYLWLPREPTQEETTFGSLYINGVRFCETLEDTIRERAGVPVATWKIHGRTAIPAGLYRVRWTRSPRFGRDTPEVIDVPGFDGIRMHSGNRSADTDGCQIVGRFRVGLTALGDSLSVRLKLDALVKAASDRQEAIWLRIDNPRLTESGLAA